MRVTFEALQETFEGILLAAGFPENKARVCAQIFASNSRDGVYSHGLNRFPVFMDYVSQGLIDPRAEPKKMESRGLVEIWDGFRGPGMYNASICMRRAMEIATSSGIGLVAIRHNNHWMRGGTYGLMAAEAGQIGICFTNALASMAPYGGNKPRLGNNPLVIGIPHPGGPILLDMAMSQFSYGKMQEYELAGTLLPVPGGYDVSGELTRDPKLIREHKSALPIGFWKGSGLALVLDILLSSLAGGLSTADITVSGKEAGLSQCFICISWDHMHPGDVDEILRFTRSATDFPEEGRICYPGERMMATRMRNEKEGIPVDPGTWKKVLEMPGARSAG